MGKGSASDEINLSPRLAELTKAVRLYAEVKDHRDLLQQVVVILPPAMQVERCSIFFQDFVNKRAMLQSGTHLVDRELSCPLEGTVVGEVIATGEIRQLNHVDPSSPVQTELQRITDFITRSLLCVPIFNVNGKKVNGAIQVMNRVDDQPFSAQDVADLVEVARVLSPAVRELVNDYEKFIQVYRKGGGGRMAEFLGKWFPQWFHGEK